MRRLARWRMEAGTRDSPSGVAVATTTVRAKRGSAAPTSRAIPSIASAGASSMSSKTSTVGRSMSVFSRSLFSSFCQGRSGSARESGSSGSRSSNSSIQSPAARPRSDRSAVSAPSPLRRRTAIATRWLLPQPSAAVTSPNRCRSSSSHSIRARASSWGPPAWKVAGSSPPSKGAPVNFQWSRDMMAGV